MAKVRMAPEIADNAALKYSDYQILTALNSVLNLVYNELATASSDITMKIKKITLNEGEGKLPKDFVVLVNVFADGKRLDPEVGYQDVTPLTYKLRGNKIYTDNSTVTLEYRAGFTEITNDTKEDELELPGYFMELLKDYTVMILAGGATGSDGSLSQRVASDISSIVVTRSFNRIVANPDSIPWRV
jgi:hypothetical protein